MRSTRLRTPITVIVAAALFLTACSKSTDPADKPSQENTPAANSADAQNTGDSAPNATFPATVKGIHGDVTVPKKPERIVALDPTMGARLLALGIKPVAVGGDPEELKARTPWLQGQLPMLDPDLATRPQVKAEKVATYKPDLIVGWGYQLPAEVHQQISQIAPAYAHPKVNPDWRDSLKDLAVLTGTDATPALAKVEQMCQTARDQIPQWQGKTFQTVGIRPDGSLNFGNGAALSCFGLKLAPNQKDSAEGAGISSENLNELNADFVGISDNVGGRDKLEKDPRFATLPSKVNGSLTYVDIPLSLAADTPDGPLSFGYLIEHSLPKLKATNP